VYTIQDLLNFFPRYHHDYSIIVSINQLDGEYLKTIRVGVNNFKNIKLKGRGRTMQKAKLTDHSGTIDVTWFNQPFLENTINKSEEFFVVGKLDSKSQSRQLLSPEIEPILDYKENIHTARITPVYSLTEGIKQKWLRQKIKWVLDYLEYITDLSDNLPDRIKDKFGLVEYKDALRNIHFPPDRESLTTAKNRLAFDEMLSIQLKVEKNKLIRQNQKSIEIDTKLAKKTVEKFINLLPFDLTQGQLSAISDILEDFDKPQPMRRLIQGDVGSGKTIIAIVSGIITALSGKDVAIMAPTAILANQLYNEFRKYVEKFKIETILMTTDTKNRAKTISKQDTINTKEATFPRDTGHIWVGTHALLYSNNIKHSSLGLVVIDEQHRFGVEQRNQLLRFPENTSENEAPNYLVMSATPIPRTIAQTIFGDMDRTIIEDKPKDRLEVKTFLTPENKRTDSYDWIKEKIEGGNQVFWVCPLIEDSEKIVAKSVKETYEQVKNHFSEYKIEYVVGTQKEKDKRDILSQFANKEFEILVSTSVIEVGIDIPNANVIIIEGSERFGLAQLHQLRGRVGRGVNQSYALLYLSDETNASKEAIERLKYFSRENDGFKVAEYDLHRRGPGEVYGIRQSGIPEFKIASIMDGELIEKTKKAAKMIIDSHDT
jgi:ATP-dependent DNA helicase RecG